MLWDHQITFPPRSSPSRRFPVPGRPRRDKLVVVLFVDCSKAHDALRGDGQGVCKPAGHRSSSYLSVVAGGSCCSLRQICQHALSSPQTDWLVKRYAYALPCRLCLPLVIGPWVFAQPVKEARPEARR